MRKISFCIPVFNEEENLHTLFGTLERFANEYKAKYEFEFFFTDNHSTDNTWLIIQKKAAVKGSGSAFFRKDIV